MTVNHLAVVLAETEVIHREREVERERGANKTVWF